MLAVWVFILQVKQGTPFERLTNKLREHTQQRLSPEGESRCNKYVHFKIKFLEGSRLQGAEAAGYE